MRECDVKRCAWAQDVPAIYKAYHDEEWGVPLRDDQKLYEMFLLETFQAGLSWITILKKRENFRAAFDNFDPIKIAAYDEEKVAALMLDAGIIRNRRKITAAVTNAAIFLDIARDFGSFSDYLWGFTGGVTVKNTSGIPPTRSELSDAISRDLTKRGMRFVGSVTIYSYLQAVGVVNDHAPDCFRYNMV